MPDYIYRLPYEGPTNNWTFVIENQTAEFPFPVPAPATYDTTMFIQFYEKDFSNIAIANPVPDTWTLTLTESTNTWIFTASKTATQTDD